MQSAVLAMIDSVRPSDRLYVTRWSATVTLECVYGRSKSSKVDDFGSLPVEKASACATSY